MADWRPSASIETLQARAILLRAIRSFFAERGVMEVETPLLCSAGVTDPALEPIIAACDDGERYLQTSPEYAMKRLLAAGSGDIYQLCKAFRAGETGRRHNPEYTLLEWYRVGFDQRQLMREVAELVSALLGLGSWQVWPYRAVFLEILDLDPFTSDVHALEQTARQRCGEIPTALDRDALLDLLMSHCIEPALAPWGMVFITDYPASQAALAQLRRGPDGEVAARFECYVDGVELANGYFESTDVEQLGHRFEADSRRRLQSDQAPRPLDKRFLAAMAAGLPSCAGVALGVDRLLACQLRAPELAATLAFDWARS